MHGVPAEDLAVSFGLAPDLTNEHLDLIVNSDAYFIERMAVTLLQMKMALP
jgi:hypothetical protein